MIITCDVLKCTGKVGCVEKNQMEFMFYYSNPLTISVIVYVFSLSYDNLILYSKFCDV